MTRSASAAKRSARQFGISSEARVAAALEAGGCTVLARNWRGGGGEIDLVVSRDQKVRFVEVKARVGQHDFEPIHPAQVHRLRRAATAFMAEHRSIDCTEACFLLAELDASGHINWTDDPF